MLWRVNLTLDTDTRIENQISPSYRYMENLFNLLKTRLIKYIFRISNVVKYQPTATSELFI